MMFRQLKVGERLQPFTGTTGQGQAAMLVIAVVDDRPGPPPHSPQTPRKPLREKLCGRALPAHGREHPRQRDDAPQGAQDEGYGKMTFQKKEEPLPIRGRRHHPERSSTLMRFPMRSYGYIHGHPHGHVHRHPHGYVHGHPHGYAHQIEGKQARRFMYMNRTQHLPRPAALEQQPECRRPDNQ